MSFFGENPVTNITNAIPVVMKAPTDIIGINPEFHNGRPMRDMSKYPFGPYLTKEFPKVPVGANAEKDTINVTADKVQLTATGKDGAWMYSYETGEIICNDTGTDQAGKTYSSY
jgi:hypothetical protein